MGETKITKNPEAMELIVERTFDAPLETVWRAWSDPEILAKWWGPRGWETIIKEFEFKPGGKWHYGMKCVDKSQGEFYGQVAWGLGVYQEINKPNSLSYKDYFSDESGEPDEKMPASTSKLRFVEVDGKTRYTGRTVFDSVEGFNKVIEMGVEQGLSESLDRLEELVTKS